MMNVIVKVYNKIKYDVTSEKVAETEYKNIKGIEIKVISDEEILKTFDETDPYKVYCIITLADESTATFRNSFVDVFRS